MGFSSITIVIFIETLNKKLNLTLRETTAFDYPNIQELAQHIAAQLQEKERKQVPIQSEKEQSHGGKEPIEIDELDSILSDFVQRRHLKAVGTPLQDPLANL